MTADCHIHSRFSPDGTEEPRALIEAAIRAGFKHIAITDHADPMNPDNFTGVEKSNLDEYIKTLLSLKEEYKNRIYVCVGLEVGYMPKAEKAAKALVEGKYPEYVINSIHYVEGRDCYFKGFFDGIDKAAAYGMYLDAVKQSLNCPYRYNALGHFGYIERNAPYADSEMTFEEFEPQITDIFRTITERGVILEVNTSVAGSPSPCLPSLRLLKVYYDMGGRKITLSSDAHNRFDIGRGFRSIESELKKIGFDELTVIRNGEEAKLKF